jgi:hypothetical protein
MTDTVSCVKMSGEEVGISRPDVRKIHHEAFFLDLANGAPFVRRYEAIYTAAF